MVRTHLSAGSGPIATCAWYSDVRSAVDAYLRELPRRISPHTKLLNAVQYSMEDGGKRFRPVLVLESCRACQGREADALPAAAAIECIHTFSLIHDDLPAMDDDELRRGKPCNHKVFGEALAILAGDWLAVEPFALLARSYPPPVAAALVVALAEGTLGMIEGQAADIEGEQRSTSPELVEFIHLQKTARLIEAACRMGGICAGAAHEQLDALGRFGRHLGLAFQITDDLLDATGSTAALGKAVGKDAGAAKQTYPAVYGHEASRRHARQEIDSAVAALAGFGGHGGRLRELAEYVIARDR